MNSLWSKPANEASAGSTSQNSPEDATSVASAIVQSAIADVGPSQAQPDKPTTGLPSRPALSRGHQPPPPAVPAPPSQAALPPDTAGGPPQQPQDSLSLAQLRRIVAEFPRSEPVAYDFVYEDQGPLEEEVDEWFVYQFWQWVRLNSVQKVFEGEWEQGFGVPAPAWDDVDVDDRNSFVQNALSGITNPVGKERAKCIAVVLYLVLGRWGVTAGGGYAGARRVDKASSVAKARQLDAMGEGVKLIAELGGLPTIFQGLRNSFEPLWADMGVAQPGSLQEAQDELMNMMTIMYMIVQQAVSYPDEMRGVRNRLAAFNPSLLSFMLDATAKLRWDEGGLIPQGQVFLLFWKTLLFAFGGLDDVADVKRAMSESTLDDKEKDLIMASPLDYHAFRQEITSKYPAYIPPQPPIPLEAETSSILLPLQNNSARNNGSNGILPGPPNVHAGGASILHQPVHIATPAPSPPPSPAVGGKGGKKQNYQTNQNFPFMYPPLDATSNGAGGKGLAGLQDLLVGRKWEGSDVPASILEAGEIFSRRVRMTRATRQLWEERERFIRFERGWDDEVDEDLIDELDLSSLSLSEREELGLVKPGEGKTRPPPASEVDYGPKPEEVDDTVKRKLDDIERFYGDALPQLQSLVIVLLKTILVNVAVAMAQGTQAPPHPGMPAPNNGGRVNGMSLDAMNAMNGTGNPQDAEASAEELDAARTREINAKAVSGIMLLLLKWFKVSHVLKFEYLTQLLLDCNYVPVLLKLWAHQDVQQLVDSKTDRIENSFFYFCNVRAGASEKAPQDTDQDQDAESQDPQPGDENESDDEAAPPPIKRRRSPPQPQVQQQPTEDQPGQARPEVDELGYPVNELPHEPITDFSRRNFFSLINLLRVMQKICKNKAHRNLLLVHYKSSNFLRRMLKVPQQELRLYTLKLFKNQVPYCGRKWRQGNMRVITAVYLHCRPELRDEWLAGSDIDAEVEEALPLEQALRSLTHWHNVRRYPDRMAAEVRAALREEQDFFVRELDRLDLQWGEVGDGESVMSEWDGIPG